MTRIPLQSEMDPADPKEHALWALVGLPGPGAQAPLILPVEVMRQWSQHLYDAGFRHHPELQQIKYVPPIGDVSWISGSAGRWAPIDEELPPELTAPSVDHLSPEEKKVLLTRLRDELEKPAPPSPGDFASENATGGIDHG